MRVLSTALFALAALVAGCAVLVYGFLTTMACGYAPGAASCHAWPWELGRDDRLWLVQLPAGITVVLLALAIWAYRKARAD